MESATIATWACAQFRKAREASQHPFLGKDSNSEALRRPVTDIL